MTDSMGNTFFLSSNLGYDEDKLRQAFYFLNKGIEKFPTRLDIRFGKCYILGAINDYQNLTAEIVRTVKYSVSINDQWLWTENKKLDDPQKFMLGTVQAYLKQLYDTENDSLLRNIIEIGDMTLTYYPRNVEILSTTSVAYMLDKNYDKAIKYLKQAEDVNPKDYIVLNNIAQAYLRKDDKANAKKYYELTIKYGDAEAIESARKRLEELDR